jgi:hypothetical protein
VVEHEPQRGSQRPGLERLCSAQPLLLGNREQDLETDRRGAPRAPGAQLDQYRHGRLVVGAEDRLAAAPINALVQQHLDRGVVGDGVEVAGEHHPAVALPRNAGDQVAGSRRGRSAGRVLRHLHAELAQFSENGVRDGTLIARRAGDLAQSNEAVEHPLVLAHGRRLCASSRF